MTKQLFFIIRTCVHCFNGLWLTVQCAPNSYIIVVSSTKQRLRNVLILPESMLQWSKQSKFKFEQAFKDQLGLKDRFSDFDAQIHVQDPVFGLQD